MKHAEVLTDRILFLDGLPNYQRLFHVRVGQTVKEMFEADRQIEVEAIDRLKRGIKVMREKGDVTSANIFESILEDEEHHIDYLDTQLELLEKLGDALYIAQLIEQPESDRLNRGGFRDRLRALRFGEDRPTLVGRLTARARPPAEDGLDPTDAGTAVRTRLAGGGDLAGRAGAAVRVPLDLRFGHTEAVADVHADSPPAEINKANLTLPIASDPQRWGADRM
ncbi:hypothetical protein SALBM311S_01890 [Streptomyces alboniger]